MAAIGLAMTGIISGHLFLEIALRSWLNSRPPDLSIVDCPAGRTCPIKISEPPPDQRDIEKRSAAIGLTDAGVAFAIVPLSGILFFAVVFTLAVANTRDPETHKRLMLLAAISILDAAVARWFLTFLAPPGSVGPPPVEVTIIPAFVAYLLLLPA